MNPLRDFPALVKAIPLPTCGKCGKPVDRIRTWLDESAARMMLRVYCHGKSETAALNEEIIEDMKFAGFGVAFSGPPALSASGQAQLPAAEPPAHSTRRLPPTE